MEKGLSLIKNRLSVTGIIVWAQKSLTAFHVGDGNHCSCVHFHLHYSVPVILSSAQTT